MAHMWQGLITAILIASLLLVYMSRLEYTSVVRLGGRATATGAPGGIPASVLRSATASLSTGSEVMRPAGTSQAAGARDEARGATPGAPSAHVQPSAGTTQPAAQPPVGAGTRPSDAGSGTRLYTYDVPFRELQISPKAEARYWSLISGPTPSSFDEGGLYQHVVIDLPRHLPPWRPPPQVQAHEPHSDHATPVKYIQQQQQQQQHAEPPTLPHTHTPHTP
ncbi:hypothetical protein T492DRAFT_453103 [Pavlovales sp. CCMP2436]|nr:hypothetical protein T492DRAFT_453103 [Pavlovales sp. CCMP2436]